jgi:hypothetical protein
MKSIEISSGITDNMSWHDDASLGLVTNVTMFQSHFPSYKL